MPLVNYPYCCKSTLYPGVRQREREREREREEGRGRERVGAERVESGWCVDYVERERERES
eukprot:1595920-Rhodomonas_salina.1